MPSTYRRLVVFIGSNTFFAAILTIFLMSALWLAISSRYPMAFDEQYHIGLIKLHALQWSPIFTHQPAGVAQYGALTRDPSYLYHWLMSIPYRLLMRWHLSEMSVITILRLINIALFGASIIIIRRVLLKTKASPAVINTTFLFFILTPVVPFLAATINYDNLQNLLLAVGLLYLIRFREGLHKKSIDLTSALVFVTIGLVGSLVKFTFLPFLTAFTLYFIYALVRFYLAYRRSFKKSLLKNLYSISKIRMIVFAALLVLSVGLFIYTYGINIFKYHNPVPQCGQVVGYARCRAYSPWYRNYQAAIHNKGVNPNPILYTLQWVGGMFNRLYFVINGHAPVNNYQNFVAPLLGITVILVGAFGSVLACIYGRKILKADPVLRLILFVSLVYVASLWGRNYHDYLHLGQAVAINGRYLIPILPFFFVFIAQAYKRLLVVRVKAKAVLLGITFLLFLQGGGASSFIYYSSDAWYWPNNRQIQVLNHAAKKVITPLFLNHYIKSLDFYNKGL